MAKVSVDDFVSALKEWTVVDVMNAIKAIETEFGVTAAAPVAAAAAPAAGGSAAAVRNVLDEVTPEESGQRVATVDDGPGRMPTTAQITSTATAMRVNTYDSVNPIRARSVCVAG